jgi:hypothetical protein
MSSAYTSRRSSGFRVGVPPSGGSSARASAREARPEGRSSLPAEAGTLTVRLVVSVALLLLAAAPGVAEQPQAAPGVPAAEPRSDREELHKLGLRKQEVSDELRKVMKRLTAARTRAMKQDRELQALHDQMAGLKRRIDARLVEKHPDFAELHRRHGELLAEYDRIKARARDLLRKRTEAKDLTKHDKAQERE